MLQDTVSKLDGCMPCHGQLEGHLKVTVACKADVYQTRMTTGHTHLPCMRPSPLITTAVAAEDKMLVPVLDCGNLLRPTGTQLLDL